MVKRGTIHFDKKSGLYTQSVTLTNVGVTLSQVVLVVRDLTAGVMLVNDGKTSCTSTGDPFIMVPNDLRQGKSASITLRFSNPSKGSISYMPRVLAGTGAP